MSSYMSREARSAPSNGESGEFARDPATSVAAHGWVVRPWMDDDHQCCQRARAADGAEGASEGAVATACASRPSRRRRRPLTRISVPFRSSVPPRNSRSSTPSKPTTICWQRRWLLAASPRSPPRECVLHGTCARQGQRCHGRATRELRRHQVHRRPPTRSRSGGPRRREPAPPRGGDRRLQRGDRDALRQRRLSRRPQLEPDVAGAANRGSQPMPLPR